ncbi:MAG: VWA domain-containing protein [Phycisphaerae bacterium]|nr:VWA domain-containing protein [Phycisphaerae bacterium]
MKRTTLYLTLGIVAVLALIPTTAIQGHPPVTVEIKIVPAVRRDVDIAICLDTSGSMDGLIEAAKQKLWAIVNELAKAQPKPRLRVALYHYGNDGLSQNTGWVKQLSPLTDDLDKIYEELFKLRTNGGTEFVARVTKAATDDLKWSSQKDALKMIIVAGNEPATQDQKYELHDICKASLKKGIIINTIFCGDVEQGRKTGWSDAAGWGQGQYAAIDQNRGTIVIKTPYDEKIIKLNIELNTTYVGYGKQGKKNKMRQTAQDANAKSLNAPAAASRTASKASGLYVNSDWDVVDAVQNKKLDLEKAPAKDLPEAMRKMSVEQRKQYVEKLAASRKELQSQINELNKKRLTHQKREMEKQGIDESKSFDANLRKAIQKQGAEKGLNFSKK